MKKTLEAMTAVGVLFLLISFSVQGIPLKDKNSIQEKIRPATTTPERQGGSQKNTDEVKEPLVERPVRWPVTEDPEKILKENFFTTFDASEDLADPVYERNFEELGRDYDTTEDFAWSLLKSAFTQEQGFQKYTALFALKGPKNESPYPDDAMVGGGTLLVRDGYWELQSLNKNLRYYYWRGGDLDPEIVRIGPEKIGFLFEDFVPGTGGYSQVYTSILVSVGSEFREVFEVLKSEDNRLATNDAGSQYSYDSVVTFVSGKNPAYYDIKVVKVGTSGEYFGNEKFKVTPVSETTLYEFRGGEYVKRP